MLKDGKLWIAKNENPQYLHPKMANRHGLIAGATYTCRVVLADGTEDETCPFVPQINPQPQAAPAASKMLQNSRIYIIRGEQHYTIEGLKMKN